MSVGILFVLSMALFFVFFATTVYCNMHEIGVPGMVMGLTLMAYFAGRLEQMGIDKSK